MTLSHPSALAAQFTSSKEDWETPTWLVDALAPLAFDLDVCASRPNVCAQYYTKERDGLAQWWTGKCWMNPPYGKGIKTWVEKARKATCPVVCLLPVRSDTKWWHAHIPHASLVVFLRVRLSFSGTKQKAPFTSALVVFGELPVPDVLVLKSLGWAVETCKGALL